MSPYPGWRVIWMKSTSNSTTDTRMVDDVEYRRPSTDSSESLRFSRMKLKNNDDVRTVFSIFCQYSTRGPIEFDASLVRFVEEIRKSLIRTRTYEEIRALLEAPYEEFSLDDLWYTMFYFITCIMLFFITCFILFLLCVLCCFLLRVLYYVLCSWTKLLYVVELSCFVMFSFCVVLR